jgi:hypothetical protein
MILSLDRRKIKKFRMMSGKRIIPLSDVTSENVGRGKYNGKK